MEMCERIKSLRKKRGYTLKALAERVGCTDAYISQIETGKAVPSISILKKLAEALDEDMRNLICEEKRVDKISLTPEERAKILYPGSRIRAELLVNKISNKAMEPLYKVVPVGEGSKGVHQHEGEEFGYILKGSLELCVGDQKVILHEGDSFYFNAQRPHSYRNVGDKDVETIWVVSPPVL